MKKNENRTNTFLLVVIAGAILFFGIFAINKFNESEDEKEREEKYEQLERQKEEIDKVEEYLDLREELE